MDAFIDTSGIDMNNPSNLSIYAQLVCFKSNTIEETSIDILDNSQLETARYLSNAFGLGFCFCVEAHKAIFTRTPLSPTTESTEPRAVTNRESGPDQDIANADINWDLFIQDACLDAPHESQNSNISLGEEPSMNMSECPFAEMELEELAFGDFQIGYEPIDCRNQKPDWSDLDAIIDRHQYDMDLDMVDESQLHGNIPSFVYGSYDTTFSGEIVLPGLATSDPLPDIAEWRELSAEPVTLSSPQPTCEIESPNKSPEGETTRGIDIVKKSSSNESFSSSYHASSSFQESVFSSTPGCSSLLTYESSPRRLGSLDSATRAKGNAVKAMGACWRCKFLRKPCNTETRCSTCPKGTHGGPWQNVGCKRGDIKHRMLSIHLCQKRTLGSSSTSVVSETDQPWLYANHSHQEIIKRRDAELKSYATNSTKDTQVDAFLRSITADKSALLGLRWTRTLSSELGDDKSAVLWPLDECIMAIVWGLLDCNRSQEILHSWMTLHTGTLEEFILLLSCAALYQATLESNQLIAYSLTCLRMCIEALHVQEASPGSLGPLSHQSCESSLCKVDCIRRVELHLEQYLDELSRVIFLKENLRNRNWWLSAFYSFCIQAVVRKALDVLCCKDGSNSAGKEDQGPAEYLHIAIRLFIASGSSHDPIVRDWSSEFAFVSHDDGAPRPQDYQNAQTVVKQSDWTAKDIKGSANYLKRLFEDDGGELTEPDDEWSARLGSANFTTYPEPYLPKAFNLDSCRQLRADWDMARCNYTKEVVRIVKEYGHESKTYFDTEEKWASIEALWKKFNDITIANTVKNSPRRAEVTMKSTCEQCHKKGLPCLGTPCPACIYSKFPCKPSKRKSFNTTKPSRKLDSLFQPLDASSISNETIPTLLPPVEPPASDILNFNLKPAPGPHYPDELYHPTWIRGSLSKSGAEEGWCGFCRPGRWLRLDGEYQDDMDFGHGISGLTGRRVELPGVVMRSVREGVGEEVEEEEDGCEDRDGDGDGDYWGLCEKCGEWVELKGKGLKNGEVGWFLHRFGCY